MNKKIIFSVSLIFLIGLAVFVSAYEEEYEGADGLLLKLVDASGNEESNFALTYQLILSGSSQDLIAQDGEPYNGKRFGVQIETYSDLSELKNVFALYNGNLISYEQQNLKEIEDEYGMVRYAWISNNKIIKIIEYSKNDQIMKNVFLFLFKQVLEEYPSTVSLSDFCEDFGVIEVGRYCSKTKMWVDQKGKEEFCENNYECQSSICVDNMCVEKGLFTKFLEWFKNLFK